MSPNTVYSVYICVFAQALYTGKYHNSHHLPEDLKGEVSVVAVKVVYSHR